MAKKVLSRRLTERKKGSEIRKEIGCRGIRGLRGNLLQVSLRQDTFWNPKNSGSKAYNKRHKDKYQGFVAGFGSDDRDGRVWQRRRWVGGDMGDTSLKFGEWR